MNSRISGHTRAFAVLGHPIGHTLSPVMHNAALSALGLDGIYLAFDVAPEALMRVLEAMGAMGFGGANLTVPLKEVAFRGISDLAPSARAMGAVNTVEFRETGLRGHNTDGAGFLRALREAFGVSPQGLSVFVLGCGGAGRAVAGACAAEGAGSIALADAEPERCERLKAALLEKGALVKAVGNQRAEWVEQARRADLVVQATPLGMKTTDLPPLPAEAFRSGQMAFDLVYNLPETAFMRMAASAGARAVNGLGMLLHQGAEAFTIWTGREAPVEAMRSALAAALYGTEAR